jgi:hypothetical protein
MIVQECKYKSDFSQLLTVIQIMGQFVKDQSRQHGGARRFSTPIFHPLSNEIMCTTRVQPPPRFQLEPPSAGCSGCVHGRLRRVLRLEEDAGIGHAGQRRAAAVDHRHRGMAECQTSPSCPRFRQGGFKPKNSANRRPSLSHRNRSFPAATASATPLLSW